MARTKRSFHMIPDPGTVVCTGGAMVHLTLADDEAVPNTDDMQSEDVTVHVSLYQGDARALYEALGEALVLQAEVLGRRDAANA